LLALSPRQRAVLWLSEFEGLADTAIAETLRLSEATVRVHRHRARARLRAFEGGGS
jgi:RNA polymerase sigma factor (sigma-70 family)